MRGTKLHSVEGGSVKLTSATTAWQGRQQQAASNDSMDLHALQPAALRRRQWVQLSLH